MRKADGDRQLLGELTEAVIRDPTQGARATKVWSLTQYSSGRCSSKKGVLANWGILANQGGISKFNLPKAPSDLLNPPDFGKSGGISKFNLPKVPSDLLKPP